MSSAYTSLILNIKRVSGNVIPYEYNYYVALAFYTKLNRYNTEVRKLHDRDNISIHTFSNIISQSFKFGTNGISLDDGFIIFRSIDKRMESHLRLAIAEDPHLRICDATYLVRSIKNTEKPKPKDSYKFRTLSPVVVRDFESRTKYVDSTEDLELNLRKSMTWVLENKLMHSPDKLDIKIFNGKRKTVRISSQNKKEAITSGFNLTGSIEADPLTFELLYHKGLGSKTGLGLGCFEVDY